jgi:hypothetical protein
MDVTNRPKLCNCSLFPLITYYSSSPIKSDKIKLNLSDFNHKNKWIIIKEIINLWNLQKYNQDSLFIIFINESNSVDKNSAKELSKKLSLYIVWNNDYITVANGNSIGPIGYFQLDVTKNTKRCCIGITFVKDQNVYLPKDVCNLTKQIFKKFNYHPPINLYNTKWSFDLKIKFQ